MLRTKIVSLPREVAKRNRMQMGRDQEQSPKNYRPLSEIKDNQGACIIEQA